MKNILRAIAVLTLASLLGACASMVDQNEFPDNWSAARLYQESRDALAHEDYPTAIQYLEKLETRFPFGAQTQQGMLMAAYAYYKNNDPESAIATAERFIKLYPTHPDADYAFYLRGLAHFHSRDSFMDDLFDVDPARRDPESVRRSFQYFAELLKRYPGSTYAKDARQRMVFLRNSLARHEVHVAQYYLERGAYVAAANRARHILERYQQTPAVAEALAVMIRAYHRLGLADLARDSLAVLQANHPKHPEIRKLEKLILAS